ncbi:MAG: 2-C-methyl-D-erythritol 2,4-cyclodiphosphate synthase, partial [Actinomycetota bacterium]
MRVGIGFDVHAYAGGRKLVLGGVEIDYEKGLEGHSDADVLVHAITDAILGACGLGDIGIHFPDSDMKYKDISSLALLGEVR